MKYTTEVTITLPKEKVVELFIDPENLKHWQNGLEDFKSLSGEPGEEGSQNLMRFKMEKREIVMKETIISNKLPDEMVSSYETKGVYNLVVSKFEPIDEKTTKYISENEFKFTTFMMKMIGFFMPGAFKKQSQQYQDQFKAFAEGNGNE